MTPALALSLVSSVRICGEATALRTRSIGTQREPDGCRRRMSATRRAALVISCPAGTRQTFVAYLEGYASAIGAIRREQARAGRLIAQALHRDKHCHPCVGGAAAVGSAPTIPGGTSVELDPGGP